jgi:hypothetical protein
LALVCFLGITAPSCRQIPNGSVGHQAGRLVLSPLLLLLRISITLGFYAVVHPSIFLFQ